MEEAGEGGRDGEASTPAMPGISCEILLADGGPQCWKGNAN